MHIFFPYTALWSIIEIFAQSLLHVNVQNSGYFDLYFKHTRSYLLPANCCSITCLPVSKAAVLHPVWTGDMVFIMISKWGHGMSCESMSDRLCNVNNTFMLNKLTLAQNGYKHISLKYIPKGAMNKMLAVVEIMAWQWTEDKPLPEPMMP